MEVQSTAWSPARILVTGADGYVGHAVCGAFIARAVPVRGVVHGAQPRIAITGVDYLTGIDLAVAGLPPAALAGVTVLVHLAARVHLRGGEAEDFDAYRALNAEATRCIAQHAAEVGVRRFVYMSSIAVNGIATARKPFTEDDPPDPKGAYAVSKRLGEERLRDVARRHGIEAVIVRPPMVYGPHAKANFLRLLRAVAGGWPLPLAGIANRRHFIGLGNLADAVVRLSLHGRPLEGVFLVADEVAVSTPEFACRIASALGKAARLFPLPRALLRKALTLCGDEKMASALCDDLRIEGTRLRTELGWTPGERMESELERVAKWFLGTGGTARVDG